MKLLNRLINSIRQINWYKKFKRNLYRAFITKIDYKKCKYCNVVGLGYNCEISLRLEDIFLNHYFEKYLYSYSYEYDREKFLESLNHLNNFAESQYTITSWGMIRHEKYNITFHSSYNLLKTNISTNNDDSIKNAIQKLKSKLQYLSDKTENLFKKNQKTLFIIKIKRTNIEDDIKYIEKLNRIIKSKFNNNTNLYTLLVVLEKKGIPNLQKELKKIIEQIDENIKIETILNFGNDDSQDITGDIFGWYRILKKHLSD